MTLNVFVINLLNGISFGSVLFLLASGLSIIFGLMGILNLSHGALYMVGAYVGWTVAVKYGLNFGLAVLAGGLTAGALGLFIEQGFLRRLYKQLNEQVLLTFGFVYILTNVSLWIWGPLARPAFTAGFLSGSFPIGHWSYPIARAGIIITGLILAVGLWWLQNKTRMGAIVRAGMDDKEMTMGLGVNLDRVSIVLFFLGSFLAGFAGVIGAQFLGVNLGFGINILLLALVVIVIGGMGSVEGALLGSMVIGIIDAFGKALFPGLAMFLTYFVMIIVLLVRPAGLLGRMQKG
jgi:branched-chain amino acid transport system permease protein